MKELARCLREGGHQPVELDGKALVLPFGGRVLGLYPDGRTNVFWVNPALLSPDTAAAFLSGEGWRNLGGDRSWISPEVETNIGDPDRAIETYNVPGSVDPGNYSVVSADEQSVTLETDILVPFLRSGRDVHLKLTKKATLLEAAPTALAPGMSFAGYVMESTLTASAALPNGVRPALWELVQVPGGGEIVVPAAPDAQPRAFIGKPEYTMAQGRIRCAVQTSASYKFSLRAPDCRGVIACINTAGETATLILRHLTVLEPERYADVPYDDLSETGHVQQVYVDDGGLGGFGELEYHTPALAPGRCETLSDRAEVWAFAGPADALSRLLDDHLS